MAAPPSYSRIDRNPFNRPYDSGYQVPREGPFDGSYNRPQQDRWYNEPLSSGYDGAYDGRYHRPHDASYSAVGGSRVSRHATKPSAYNYVFEENPRVESRFNPRNWSRRSWIISIIGLTVVVIIAIIAGVVAAKSNAYPNYSPVPYTLVDTYAGASFFDNFNYFTGYDPAAGFVHYVDGPGSQFLNLTYATPTSAVIKVDDSTTVDASTGRRSVRITSKKTYNSGLFIFDVLHTPYGCATWPALWLTDPANWPLHGEIDVVEAVNTATTGNQMTLHTGKGCSMSAKRKEAGKVLHTNCYNATNDNLGCGVQAGPASFGEQFNKDQGGVYAMELREAGIRVWFFPRSSIPADIDLSVNNGTASTTKPDPSTWGQALADFPSTHCDIGSHFQNQSIIANIDLCGQWAGQPKYYTTEAGCPGDCPAYVASNGSSFSNAYWEFGSFKVYQAS